MGARLPCSAAPGQVTLVGTGVVGRGWIRVFARAGSRVVLHDSQPGQAEAALAWLGDELAAEVAEGRLAAERAGQLDALVTVQGDLSRALAGANYVQESVPEDLGLKRALFAELDRLAPPGAILASSTSALPIAEIAADCVGAHRCLMAHPFNPAHLMPAVEMLAGPRTDPVLFERACAWLAACGQVPVRMARYVPGFLGNRIQAAVVREALHLVEQGVADPLAVDAVIREGLALRWATIGNFGANHTNAAGGIGDYFARYGQSYRALMETLEQTSPAFEPETLAAIGAALQAQEGVRDVAGLCRKRDRLLARLGTLKEEA